MENFQFYNLKYMKLNAKHPLILIIKNYQILFLKKSSNFKEFILLLPFFLRMLFPFDRINKAYHKYALDLNSINNLNKFFIFLVLNSLHKSCKLLKLANNNNFINRINNRFLISIRFTLKHS